MTLLKSYIQPRFLYYLTLACTPEVQLNTYFKVKNWFLSTLRAKYNPNTPTISKAQALHPTTCFGLLPIRLEVDFSRVEFLLRACAYCEAQTLQPATLGLSNPYSVFYWISKALTNPTIRSRGLVFTLDCHQHLLRSVWRLFVLFIDGHKKCLLAKCSFRIKLYHFLDHSSS